MLRCHLIGSKHTHSSCLITCWCSKLSALLTGSLPVPCLTSCTCREIKELRSRQEAVQSAPAQSQGSAEEAEQQRLELAEARHRAEVYQRDLEAARLREQQCRAAVSLLPASLST